MYAQFRINFDYVGGFLLDFYDISHLSENKFTRALRMEAKNS